MVPRSSWTNVESLRSGSRELVLKERTARDYVQP